MTHGSALALGTPGSRHFSGGPPSVAAFTSPWSPPVVLTRPHGGGWLAARRGGCGGARAGGGGAQAARGGVRPTMTDVPRVPATSFPLPVPLLPHLSTHRILCVGAAGLDFTAVVDTFPAADAKVRSSRSSASGGGNAANTAVAARRLGVQSAIVALVGRDAAGGSIRQGLASEGVDTSPLVVAADPCVTSPFTYILVDASAGTRTCIHSPAAVELTPADVPPPAELLAGVSLLHVDGRQPDVAVPLAAAAVAAGIPVLMDAEKVRPGTAELLPLVDYIVCNATFPRLYAPHCLGTQAAMADLLRTGATRAAWVISTDGAAGATMLRRAPPVEGAPRMYAPEGVAVVVTHTTFPPPSECVSCEEGEVMDVVACPAWLPTTGKVVDTTGAGDAYIGAVAVGLVAGAPVEALMAFGAVVGGKAVGGLGARGGGSRWDEPLPPDGCTLADGEVPRPSLADTFLSRAPAYP
ncbi:hypothetical protein MMPV_008635 [Pyropia vietnamensis]